MAFGGGFLRATLALKCVLHCFYFSAGVLVSALCFYDGLFIGPFDYSGLEVD
jgi:hypothetical protein